MNPSITTLDPISHNALAKNILARNGLNCAILALAPGDETAATESQQNSEQILFVIDGQATVRFGDVNTVVNKDEALHIAAGRPYAVAGHAAGWTKLLRVEIPSPRVIAPIITFPNS